ncbi:esterase/lipase family protein [Maricaulis sp. CAU 1757]
MPAHVAILHGWSDSSKSFRDLKTFLEANGHDAAQVWLGDYTSMDDDVRIEDVAKRMQVVLGELIAEGKLARPFDLIVHSTGGLVARQWLMTCYPDGEDCPVKRIIMLAPANFGSRLAAMGKSMIGRLVKGWNNWFQTGEEMLRALELGSAFQWNLARRDLLDASGSGDKGPYGGDGIWPFVITGTRGYPDRLRQIVNEAGADGTVRACAANLNAHGMTVDFSRDRSWPDVRPWTSRVRGEGIPCAILPERDHGTITRPDSAELGAEADMTGTLGQLILQALACRSAQDYDRIYRDWHARSEATAALAGQPDRIEATFEKPRPDTEDYHQYMQFVVHAVDDHGHPVDDYFLEFFSPDARGDRDAVYFHREVLEHVHTNSRQPSRRCLFIDRTDLVGGFYRLFSRDVDRRLAVSLSAAPPGPNVRYFDKTREGAHGHVLLHDGDASRRAELDARLHRSATHLVELILPRQPVDKVFRLSS